MKPTLINLKQAQELGYNELFFTWTGIGDNLALLFAANEYYRVHQKKLLIGTNIPELYANSESVDIISGFSFQEFNHDHKYQKLMESLHNSSITPFFINASKFKSSFEHPGKYIMQWPEKHLLAEYCEKIGLSGKVKIAPGIMLSLDEKKIGRFFKKNQIAIMSNGIMRYKTWPIKKTQGLINRLYRDYNFVQIGAKSDIKLDNCLDYRGKITLRGIASILHNSDLFVGGIGGLMHLARFASCRAIVSYSNAEGKYLAAYPCNVNISPKYGCRLCSQNLRDPQHQVCNNYYMCINDITIDDMAAGIETQLARISDPLEDETVNISANKSTGLTELFMQKKRMWIPSAIYHNHVYRTKLNILGINIFESITNYRDL